MSQNLVQPTLVAVQQPLETAFTDMIITDDVDEEMFEIIPGITLEYDPPTVIHVNYYPNDPNAKMPDRLVLSYQ